MRMYEYEGNSYPSVTTILKLISNTEELMQWANIMGFKRKSITKIKDDSSSFGTKVHSHLQYLVDPNNTEKPLFKDKLEEYTISNIINNFKKYFEKIDYKTICTEKTMISSKLGYGGTLDWIVEINNFIIMVDFKTSKTPYSVYYLQLGGYYNLLKEEGFDLINFSGILIINEKTCRLHPITIDELKKYGEMFNILFDFYSKWKNNPKIDYDIINILKLT